MISKRFLLFVLFGLSCQVLWAQPASLSAGNIEELIRPTNGLWWSPDEPGTGLSLEFSTDGPWFGSLYLYNDDGTPQFLTMQGTAVQYALDRQGLSDTTLSNGVFTLGTYALAEGTVNSSAGGLCLGCDWQQPDTTSLLARATIEFVDLDLALLTIRDTTTDEILLQQTLEPFVPGQASNDEPESSYSSIDVTISLLGNGFASQDAATSDGFGLRIYFTGQYGVSYNCVDSCGTEADQVINRIDTFCMFSQCHGLAFNTPMTGEAIGYQTFISTKRGLIIGVMDESTADQYDLPTQIIIDSLYR